MNGVTWCLLLMSKSIFFFFGFVDILRTPSLSAINFWFFEISKIDVFGIRVCREYQLSSVQEFDLLRLCIFLEQHYNDIFARSSSWTINVLWICESTNIQMFGFWLAAISKLFVDGFFVFQISGVAHNTGSIWVFGGGKFFLRVFSGVIEER